MISQPIQNLFSQIKIFLYVAIICGFLSSLVSVVFGIDINCLFGIDNLGYGCNISSRAILSSSLIKTILFYLCIIWYAVSLDRKSIQRPQQLFCRWKSLLVGLGALILFCLLNLTPVFSLYLMYVRVPNENWKIEMFVFAFFFVLFLLPIVVIRFYSIFWEAISFNHIETIKRVWMQTSSNVTKLLAVSFLWLLVCVGVLRYYYSLASANANSAGLLSSFVFEWGYVIVLFFGAATFVNIASVQNNILQGDNK